jgi:hypothetical protein
LAEDEMEINKLVEKRAKIDDMIPAEINLGLYIVRCSKVKWELQVRSRVKFTGTNRENVY